MACERSSEGSIKPCQERRSPESLARFRAELPGGPAFEVCERALAVVRIGDRDSSTVPGKRLVTLTGEKQSERPIAPGWSSAVEAGASLGDTV